MPPAEHVAKARIYERRFRPKNPNPNSPRPINERLAGSGTEDVKPWVNEVSSPFVPLLMSLNISIVVDGVLRGSTISGIPEKFEPAASVELRQLPLPGSMPPVHARSVIEDEVPPTPRSMAVIGTDDASVKYRWIS